MGELSIDFDLLILIGGNSWNINDTDLFDLVNNSLHKRVLVGAICGAVDFLARNGLLDNYKHTGNAQILWQDYSKYTNPKDFLEQQAVKDRNLVTANGTAPLTFTKLVLEMIHFDNDKNINKLVDLYQIGFYEYCKKYGNPYKKV